MPNSEEDTFEQVNDRLKEIVSQVEDEDMPLDDALDLFEEAVKLGMQASSLLEEDIAARNAAEEAAEGATADQLEQGAADTPASVIPEGAAEQADTDTVAADAATASQL